jgi:luciferase family oxidoreductase group 1
LPVDDFGEQLTELIGLLDGTLPARHPFAHLRVAPDMPGGPDVWLLGSSLWSSSAAAQLGLPYAFAHFFSPAHTREAIESYQRAFAPGTHRQRPEAAIAVGVICAETNEEAEYLHTSVRLLQRRIRQGDRRPVASPEAALRELRGAGPLQFSGGVEDGEWPRYFVGNPEKVHRELTAMTSALGIAEAIIVTITHSQQARLHSYNLLAEAFALDGVAAPLAGGR